MRITFGPKFTRVFEFASSIALGRTIVRTDWPCYPPTLCSASSARWSKSCYPCVHSCPHFCTHFFPFGRTTIPLGTSVFTSFHTADRATMIPLGTPAFTFFHAARRAAVIPLGTPFFTFFCAAKRATIIAPVLPRLGQPLEVGVATPTSLGPAA